MFCMGIFDNHYPITEYHKILMIESLTNLTTDNQFIDQNLPH